MNTKFLEIRTLLVIVLFAISNSLFSQDIGLDDKPINQVDDNKFISLNGPRLGFSYLTAEIQNHINQQLKTTMAKKKKII